MIVVDSSALVEMLLGFASGRQVAGRVLLSGESLHGPHLLDLEIANSFRKISIRGIVDEPAASRALEDFRALQIRRYPHTGLLPRIWQLRHNLTPYDAAYVALAESLDASLVTCDVRIASAPGHRARVELM